MDSPNQKMDPPPAALSEMLFAAVLLFLKYGIGSLVFIWVVNTLFGSAVPLTFKTWLAGCVLIFLFLGLFPEKWKKSLYESYEDYYPSAGYSSEENREDETAKD